MDRPKARQNSVLPNGKHFETSLWMSFARLGREKRVMKALPMFLHGDSTTY